MSLKSRLLLIFFGTGAFLLGVVLLFVFFTLRQIPLDEIQGALNQAIAGQSQIDGRGGDTLEGGSLVRAQDLALYVAFSARPYWQLPDGAVANPQARILSLLRDVSLPAPEANDCAELYCLQQRRPFGEIPSNLWRGLIGIEDIRFLGHVGFDVRAIFRALVRDVMSMGFVEGGSTITQQLAKNLFLSNEKSILRKLKELIVAVVIEARFEKDEIIQAYLNEVYWGVLQGIRVKGFHAASLLYFEKLPRQLDAYEALILVSMLKGPNYYHPLRSLDRLRQRVETVKKVLQEKNVIELDIASWNERNWSAWQDSLKRREQRQERPLFSWWLSRQTDSGVLGDYGKFVFIDAAQTVLALAQERAAQADLAVKAVVRPWRDSDLGSFHFYSKIERDTESALLKERHQVGSTLKPLVYAALIRLGVDLDQPVETGEVVLNLKSGRWNPAESHHVKEDFLPVAEALRQSLNRPLIRLAQETGFSALEQQLLSSIPRLQTPLAEYPSQLLGALELTVEELAQAYKEFFDLECGPSGSGVMQVLDDPTQTTIRRVVGPVMAQMRFFGKTGTSNGGRDNWFVFFDGNVISAIWVGQETGRQGEALPLYGSSTAFKILETYLLYRGRLFNDLHCVTPRDQGI